jgi:hypothetical protein
MMPVEHDTMRNAGLLPSGLLLVLAASAAAQGTLSLNQVTTLPRVDGVASPHEYSVTAKAEGMQLDLLWTTDTLYVAVSGQTTGWVGVGLGSPDMDGAVMYVGFVAGQSMELKVRQGVRHAHVDIGTNAPLQYYLRQVGGQTTLELALRAMDFIAGGQKKLDVIVGMGAADSFLAPHMARAAFTVNLTR